MAFGTAEIGCPTGLKTGPLEIRETIFNQFFHVRGDPLSTDVVRAEITKRIRIILALVSFPHVPQIADHTDQHQKLRPHFEQN